MAGWRRVSTGGSPVSDEDGRDGETERRMDDLDRMLEQAEAANEAARREREAEAAERAARDAVVDEVKPLTGLRIYGATCAARGCATAIPWRQAWCYPHWKRVPEEERYERQAAVFAARKVGATEPGRVSSTGESDEDGAAGRCGGL